MESTLIVQIQNGAALVQMNRPETYNAMNRNMASELLATLQEMDRRRDVRAILLTGVGKAFCSGQDLSDIEDVSDVPFAEIIERQYNPLVELLASMQTPIVAYVNGVAAGAGANIAHLCDIVVAHSSASFIQAFSKIGLIPDTGGTWYLPRIVGYQRALAMMMTGDKISAQQAMEYGMVYQIYEGDEALQEAIDLVTRLAQMPTLALVETKKLLLKSYSNTLEEQLIDEKKSQETLGKTQDFQEGVNAFIEKRSPDFKGQ